MCLERHLAGECFHLDVKTPFSVEQLSQLHVISRDHGWEAGDEWQGTKSRRWVLGLWVRTDQEVWDDVSYSLIH